MNAQSTPRRTRLVVTAMLLGMTMIDAGAAHAQDAAPVAPAAAPSESAMVNLVRLLVKQGVLKPAAAEALLRQAEAEAAQAKAAATPPPQAVSAELPAAAPGTIRVPYVPESVRNQIRDEIRADVMREAKEGRWASPGDAAPDWTRRVTVFGDIRFRSQSELYSEVNSDKIIDFARINASAPFNVVATPLVFPFINSRVDRVNRLRVRARLGVKADIVEGVTTTIALATGDDNSPISTNQILGGGLGKRNIYLDQGYLNLAPTPWANASFGRFPNPFDSTDLLFDDDVRFDGVGGELKLGKLAGLGIDVDLRGGAFPLDFGSGDYPVTSFTKAKVPVKYLFSGQLALGAQVTESIHVKLGAAYHSFDNVQGELSSSCALYLGVTECSTDTLKPFFLRKGNTLSFLRNIARDPTATITPQPQILGLTFDYDILNLNAAVTAKLGEKTKVSLAGDYVRNLAFKRGDLCRNGISGEPFNNGGTDGDGDICSATNPTSFTGGGTGYQVKATLGYLTPRQRGDWQAFAGYRYVESDAVLDSLTDSDFHLGGTNTKGYFVGGKFGLFDGVMVGARWMSANQIAGDPFAIDVFQIDLEAKF